jgi:DNA-binding Lrp family transcriptional regulator
MDDTDQKLISLLRQDARMSIADLAHKLKVSRGTINNRLRKLEDSQVIVGYTIRLRPDTEPETIKAWMGVLVEGNTTRQVIASLLGEPSVCALHDTNGRWDLLAEIEAPSMKDLSKALERIRLISGIRSTETNIHLASYR